MERDVERADELSPSSDEEALVLRQKPELTQGRDKGDVTLQQWKTRQLQRLAEELKAEWQEARLQQVRDMERLYLARLLDEATGRATGNNFNLYEHSQRGTAKHMRAKERNRAAFREKGRREEHPRQHPKSRKKATCSERRGSTKARVPNPCEKGKGKRVPSSKSSGGYQPVGPRVSRGADLVKLNPLLTGAGETECVEEVPREGRRPMRRGSSRFAQNMNHNSTDESLQGKTADLEKPLSLSSTFRQEATTQGSPCRYTDKNQWHKELESAFEELFNTNRKLKKHLNLHLEQKLKIDQNPDEQQSYSEILGESSDIQRGGSTEEAETTAEEYGSPSDMEAPEMWSKPNLKQLLSEAEYPRYQPMAKHLLRPESLTPVPEAGTSSEQDDSFSESPESGREPPKLATAEEESLKPYLQKQDSSIASWMALRQKQKAELEQKRQKTLLELTEHPNMSLEIHYKAELEEERRERRRMRLALLKSYSTGVPAPVSDKNISLDNGLLDEDKQSQMIRDLQQQILEQNKLHKQFLEKARKRLQEFQKTF
ncbi:protein DDC8 homolog [Arvicola amphibius]|uniref:protein DDC8 homolog n=1 Tax=Arvicola amphibius TaxID=1047088 RepID=UPI0018E3BCC4|nr:protein DDC8 homolog [Arvicola amphibius]